MEIVCGPSVLVIVNNRRHEGGENLEISQPVLQTDNIEPEAFSRIMPVEQKDRREGLTWKEIV